MTRRFPRLAWTAATFTYLLIILGAVVRITGSGLGCGEHWPLCNGKLLPPLDLPTLIEYGHRLAAAAVSVLVVALAAYAWQLRRGTRDEGRGTRGPDGPVLFPSDRPAVRPSIASYVALGLLIVQVLLGAVTVKLSLPPWTVILHLGTAMLLLATLIVTARGATLTPSATLTPGASPGILGARPSRVGLAALALGFVTVLLGALTANLGAASACLGFPLCNGQAIPAGNYLQYVHWTHRLLAFTLFGYVWWWALRTKRRGARWVVVLVTVQVALAAAMVLLALPPPLQAAHVAVGAAVWAGLVLAVL